MVFNRNNSGLNITSFNGKETTLTDFNRKNSGFRGI